MGVGDYDETERRILGAGGQVALPKMALPGMAWQGYYLDTEGNTFGIHHPTRRRRSRRGALAPYPRAVPAGRPAPDRRRGLAMMTHP